MEYPTGHIVGAKGNVVDIPEEKCVAVNDEFMRGLAPRSSGEFAGKGVWLDENYDWIIVKDSTGYKVLIALEK